MECRPLYALKLLGYKNNKKLQILSCVKTKEYQGKIQSRVIGLGNVKIKKKNIYIYRKRRNLFGQLQKKKETCLVKDDTTNPTYICALEKLAKLVKMSHGPK